MANSLKKRFQRLKLLLHPNGNRMNCGKRRTQS